MISEKYGRNTLLVGPWGGQDGLHWDDGVYLTIRQVEICHGFGIDWIKVEYDNNGSSVWSEKHGGRGGAKIDKVSLEYPDEFLISLHGHYSSLQGLGGPIFVRSLTFESNKRKYGPYGVEEGTYFTFSPNHGKIVGFIGKSGWYLNAIGVYLQPLLHKPDASESEPIFRKPVSEDLPILHKSIYADLIRHKSFNANPILHRPIYEDPILHKPVYADPIPHNPVLRKSVSAEPFLHSHNVVAHRNENYEYSMIQGSIDKNYDPIVSVRRKEDTNNPLPTHLLMNTSQNHSKTEHKKSATLVPTKTEEVPNNIAREVVTCGPWGGSGGTLFDDGIHDGIRQIYLKRNVGIVSIQVCYEKNGQHVWGNKNGGTGSFKKDTISFDYPSEILTCITGYHGPAMVMGSDVIKSLTFHTTRGKYGPYGDEQGQFFSSKLNEGSTIVGFHGKKGLFMDAIGIHALKGKVVPPPPSSQNKQVVQRTVIDPAPFGTGPWGGESGKPWDDGVFTGIKQIILTISDAITCIEFEYDRNGQSVWSVKHGGTGGQTAHRVKLEYPNEVLTCISGYYGPTNKSQGTTVIQSLSFHTSRRKYGPFGEGQGTYFVSGTTQGKVIGFHGRSSMYLDAIGVHMQHWLGQKHNPSRMKMFS